MGKLVSVIVPIYNVEDYLEECIESILGQTYKNIEIILVDDGSTDASGAICDEYAIVDKRIRVFHKNNAGLSSARNKGIEASTGEYLAFVDSDDIISTLMIEMMICNLDKLDADIVCCDFTSALDNLSTESNSKLLELTGYEAISRLFSSDGFKFFAWNKVYKRELFNGIRYPEGKLFEDIKTTYLLMMKSNRIVYIQSKLYYYRLRSSSIVQSRFSEKNYDLLLAIDFVMHNVEERKSGDYSFMLPGYMSYYLGFIKKALTSNVNITAEQIKLVKLIRHNLFCIIFNKTINYRTKVELVFFGLLPKAYVFLFRRKNDKKLWI